MEILIVDDSKSVHNFIKGSLDEYNQINFTSAFSGKDALEFIDIQKKHFDIVLLDWEMPIMDGPETIKAIRGVNQEVPIIKITSKNKMEDIQMALNLGANDYIMKPFTDDILVEKLNNYISLDK
ncbi:MAG: response regulator [Oligoflexales bacterium]